MLPFCHCIVITVVSLSTPGDVLSIDNLTEVFECTYGARAEWYNIGLKLGVHPNDLKSIRGDDDKCLRRVLEIWLQMHVTLKPTWQSLPEALRSKIVSREDVAQEVEKYLKSKMETVDSTRPEESKESTATEESATQEQEIPRAHEVRRTIDNGHGLNTAAQHAEGQAQEILESKIEIVDSTYQEESKEGTVTEESSAQGRKPITGALHKADTVVEEEVGILNTSSTSGGLKRKRELGTLSTVALQRPSEEPCAHKSDSPHYQPVIPSYYGPLKVSRVAYRPSRERIEEVKGEVCLLHRQFQDLVAKTKSVVIIQEQSGAKGTVTFQERFVCGLLSIDCSKVALHRKFLEHKVQGAESIDYIFRALSSEGWNFLNSDLLEHIIVEILADGNLQQELRKFLETKHPFCQVTTVCEFEAAKTRLLGVLPTVEIPPNFRAMVLQITKEWADYTIAEALATWRDIAEESRVRNLYPIFVTASPSNSVNLVWAVATGVVSTVAKTLANRHIRERNAIMAVCIDGIPLDEYLKTECHSQVSNSPVVCVNCM